MPYSATRHHPPTRSDRHWRDPVGGRERVPFDQRRRRWSYILGILILGSAALTFAALVGPFPHIGGGITALVSQRFFSATRSVTESIHLPSGQKASALDARAISAQLAAETSTLQGTWGVAVVDLPSGTVYGVNQSVALRAASINKLPILIVLFQLAAQRRVNLDQSVTLSEDDIQHYGTGIIQEPGAPRTYTLRELAGLMIELSDNSAARALERYLGQDTIQQAIDRWGLTHTSMADNMTTPADAARLMADLASNRLLPRDETDTALNLLEHTVFSDRLADGVPESVSVAHKIGTDVGVYNDSALVLAQGRPYAVTVLSQSTDDHGVDAVFSRISQLVYNYQRSLPATRAP